MREVTDRRAAYFERSATLRAKAPFWFQSRFELGLKVQARLYPKPEPAQAKPNNVLRLPQKRASGLTGPHR